MQYYLSLKSSMMDLPGYLHTIVANWEYVGVDIVEIWLIAIPWPFPPAYWRSSVGLVSGEWGYQYFNCAHWEAGGHTDYCEWSTYRGWNVCQQAATSDSCQPHWPMFSCPVDSNSGWEEVCGLGGNLTGLIVGNWTQRGSTNAISVKASKSSQKQGGVSNEDMNQE